PTDWHTASARSSTKRGQCAEVSHNRHALARRRASPARRPTSPRVSTSEIRDYLPLTFISRRYCTCRAFCSRGFASDIVGRTWTGTADQSMGDRYTITERVDQGGMAEVFRGVAESLQSFKKAVAIKRILPKLSRNKKFVSMFLDEARLSLHLQHANIVHVFDIGIAESAYFIVMEYVDGANLKSVVEYFRTHGRRLPVSHTLYVMLEVCKGLAYAHNAEDPESGKPLGIVHRDISPPNILLSKMGEVKLVDFGLAKATSQIAQTDPGKAALARPKSNGERKGTRLSSH